MKAIARPRLAAWAVGVGILLITSNDQASANTNPTKNANPDQRGTHQSPLVVEAYPPPKSASQLRAEKAEDQERLANDGNMVVWTRLLAAIGFLQLIVFGYQAYKLRQTVSDSKEAIGAAQRSARAAESAIEGSDAALKHAQQTSERELRAYVFVTPEEPVLDEGGLRVAILIKNFGQTPAYDLQLFYDWDTDRHPAPEKLKPPSFGKFAAKQDLGPGAHTYSRVTAASVFTDGVLGGSTNLYYYGSATYKDAFGKDRATNFRFIVQGRPSPKGGLLNVIPHYEGNNAT